MRTERERLPQAVSESQGGSEQNGKVCVASQESGGGGGSRRKSSSGRGPGRHRRTHEENCDKREGRHHQWNDRDDTATRHDPVTRLSRDGDAMVSENREKRERGKSNSDDYGPRHLTRDENTWRDSRGGGGKRFTGHDRDTRGFYQRGGYRDRHGSDGYNRSGRKYPYAGYNSKPPDWDTSERRDHVQATQASANNSANRSAKSFHSDDKSVSCDNKASDLGRPNNNHGRVSQNGELSADTPSDSVKPSRGRGRGRRRNNQHQSDPTSRNIPPVHPQRMHNHGNHSKSSPAGQEGGAKQCPQDVQTSAAAGRKNSAPPGFKSRGPPPGIQDLGAACENVSTCRRPPPGFHDLS